MSKVTERSCQVSPLSVERKRRLSATNAHTTLPDGALNCAVLGKVIGVATTVGEVAAVGVDAGVLVADGSAVGAFDAGGGAEQADERTSSAVATKTVRTRCIYPVWA